MTAQAIRQKDTGLVPTKANRQKLRRLIPEFEETLRERQEKKESKTFGQYADIFFELNAEHSKFLEMRGYVKRFKAYFGKSIYSREIKLPQVKQFFSKLTKNGRPIKRVTKTQ